ncbi:hypothetical protein V8D89_013516 [Ganoderma adspersum]
MTLPLPAKSQSSFPDFVIDRSAISNEIDDYLRKILTLKTHLNILTHINYLPTEILAQILVTYVRDHYHSATSQWDKSALTRPKWIKLTHVCRHWRDVAMNTPRFWSHVYVRRPKTFSALLPLSKSSPLYIDLDLGGTIGADGKAWDSAIELIGQHSHRLCEFRYIATSKQVRLLSEKLSHPMPLLEKLVLSHCVSKVRGVDPLRLLPATGHAPRLLHLEIYHLPVMWTDPVFCPTLTTLIVVGDESPRSAGPRIGTSEQFLDALQAMAPSLVHLTLDNCLPRFQPAASEPPPATRPIALPSLQHLKVGAITDDCVFLMDRLSMNPTAKVTVTALGVAGIPHLVEILSAHVSRTAPLLALHMFFPGITSWSVNIVGQGDVTDMARIRLDLTLRTSHLDDRFDRPLTAVLRAAKTLFSHVKTLYTSSGHERDIGWERLFMRTPSLQILDIKGHPGSGFLKALCNVQRKKKGESSRWVVPLRRLCELRLHDGRFRQAPIWGHKRSSGEFFDQLLDWVILRCNYKVPLRRMGISECKYATAKDVNRLREIVVDVEWDGWERESSEDDEDSDDFDSDEYSS